MRAARNLFALFAPVVATLSHSHPGHGAPTLHAHDLDEATAMAVVLLVAAVIGVGVRALLRAKRR